MIGVVEATTAMPSLQAATWWEARRAGVLALVLWMGATGLTNLGKDGDHGRLWVGTTVSY